MDNFGEIIERIRNAFDQFLQFIREIPTATTQLATTCFDLAVRSLRAAVFPTGRPWLLIGISVTSAGGAFLTLLDIPLVERPWFFSSFSAFSVVANVAIMVGFQHLRSWFAENRGFRAFGLGTGDNIMMVLTCYASLRLRQNGFAGLVTQLFWHANMFAYGQILRPPMDFGLQTFFSRLPFVTAVMTYGAMSFQTLAVLLLISLSTYLRRYMDRLTPEHDIDGDDGTHLPDC